MDIVVRNQTSFDASFTTELFDASATDGGSTALDFEGVGTSPRGAGSWVQLQPSAFTLLAGTERVVRARVRAPARAGAGGHYAGVRFTASNLAAGAQFDVDAVVDVPVLVTVPGNARRDLQATIVPVDRWRWSGGSATWELQVRNAGDLHENVSGVVRLAGPFTRAEDLPVASGILLPGEVRTQRLSAALREAPALVTARVQLTRDGASQVRADAKWVIVLPWWLLVVGAAATILVWWRVRRGRGSGREEHGFDIP